VKRSPWLVRSYSSYICLYKVYLVILME
jgi:hypothetical protein